MKIVLLNGPPRCGKDTVGNMMARMIPGAWVEKFAAPLKAMTVAAIREMMEPGSAPRLYENEKDSPDIPEFRGVTPRQAYIQMSESWAKKLWGPGFFGELLVERLSAACNFPPPAIIVTDCGFLPEVQEVLDAFPGDVELIHIVRPGCSFDGDSRDYVFPANLSPFTLFNDGGLNALRTNVAELLEILDIPCEETQPK